LYGEHQTAAATRQDGAEAAEAARRLIEGIAETSRHFLGSYGAYVHGLKPARHHRFWIDAIHGVVNGTAEKRNLLLLAPPGHAKSHWVSQTLPSWYLGNHPMASLLFFTSSDTMAHQFGNVVRMTFESQRHQVVFPFRECQPDTGSKTRGWSSDGLFLKGVPAYAKDPSYRAVGYGASVIGSRADGIILDDPLTQAQAQSETEQRKAKNYFDMTIQSRLKPGAWMIAIMTLWHELDLGMFLAAKSDWKVIKLPAIALDDDPLGRKTGEALWPEMYPIEFLEEKRQEPPVGIGLAEFGAAYQQDPVGLGGDVFRAGDFGDLPADFWEPREDARSMADRLRYYQFWDLGFSKQEAADFTVGVTAGLDSQNRLYVVDVTRGRWGQAETEGKIVDAIRRHGPVMVGVEQSKFHQAVTQQMLANVRKRVMVPVRAVPCENDKRTNAALSANRGQNGLLFVDKHTPWWPGFFAEHMGFPRAAHDDQVDALSGLCHMFTLQRERQPLRDVRWNQPRVDGSKRRSFALVRR
jgi:predicted phage terminase large subunit-like protein